MSPTASNAARARHPVKCPPSEWMNLSSTGWASWCNRALGSEQPGALRDEATNEGRPA